VAVRNSDRDRSDIPAMPSAPIPTTMIIAASGAR
jgi:hypothetical protein